MKSLRLIIITIVIAVLLPTYLMSQTITIDSTFTANTEIFPFGSTGTVYGLSVSGNVTLNSDTSLVRIVLIDNNFNEYLVYEAYPYICAQTTTYVSNLCDETCYSEGFEPYSVLVQVTDSDFDFEKIVMISDSVVDALGQQVQSKQETELEKVSQMQNNITANQMLWFADTNSISNLSYVRKKSLFGENYNLCGLDYYMGGIYDPQPNTVRQADSSTLVPDFDWRNRHGANDPNKQDYYYVTGRKGEGWMTSVKDQAVYSQCDGLCYIYGPLGVIEGLSNIYFNQFYDYELSVQNILECSALVEGYGDCEGGYGGALSFIRDSGVVDSLYYPRRFPNLTCGDSLLANSFNYKLFIDGSNQVIKTSPSPNKIDSIKKALIEYGPLSVSLSFYTDSLSHKMVLVGYGILKAGDTIYDRDSLFDPILIVEGSSHIGKLYWIYKNSWNIDWGDNGYMYHFDSDSDPEYSRYIQLPITVETSGQPPSRNYYDKDNDGYYNWGIGERPVSCPETELDSDDSDPRTGPFDSNYYGTPVAPQIEVSYEYGSTSPSVIENNGFVTFVSSTSLEFTITIKNEGNAQLNLQQATSSNSSVFGIEGLTPNTVGMNGDEEQFTINYTYTNGTGADQAVITIPTLEPEIGDFTFVLANYDCSQAPGNDINVISSQTWDDCRIISGDVYVKKGAELIVTGNYGFLADCDIVVERGGILRLNGAILNTACEATTWNGIDVWGTGDSSQMLQQYQGYLYVKNNSKIYNAEKAIEIGRTSNGQYISSYSGGLTIADNSYFIDNINDVTIYPFDNYTTNGDALLNATTFTNTEFINNTIAQPQPRVYLYGVNGVRFYGCTFSNNFDTGAQFTSKGTGLYSFSSGFYVSETCPDKSVPCDENLLSTFTNLEYGIYAFNGELSKYISIDSATFTNCTKGVYMSAADNQQVTRNTFITGTDNYLSDYACGLYLEGCTGYQIEENLFINESTGLSTMGIQILNSGQAYNEIYSNTFSNLTVGISAAGENRDATGNGLCIKCNDFEECVTDVYVDPGELPSGSTIGIAYKQGDLGANASAGVNPNSIGAGNTFTESPNEYNIDIESNCNSIEYTHQDISEGDPFNIRPDDNFGVNQLINDAFSNYSKEESCPSNLNSTIVDESVEKSILLSELTTISAYTDTLDLLTDGGDTESLNSDITFSLPDEAMELRQQLLDESPYLSDTAMKNAINKENVLPNIMIRDILVANPQSAKTPHVINEIDNRIVPMPDYFMVEIMSGQSVSGAAEILEQKLVYHKKIRDKSLGKLEKYYLSDTGNYSSAYDSLSALYINEPFKEAKYKLSLKYLAEGDSVSSYNTLENIPLIFELTDIEESIHEDYETLFDILEQIHCDSVLLDSTLAMPLFSISDKSNLAGNYARNILINDDLTSYFPVFYFPDIFKVTPTWDVLQSSKSEQSNLSVFPNPAGNYFIVEYNCIGFIGSKLIQVTDIYGHNLIDKIISNDTGQLLVSAQELGSGSYIVNFTINNELVDSKKVIISK